MYLSDKILEQWLTKDEFKKLRTSDRDREMLWLAAYRIAMNLRTEYVKYCETMGELWDRL